MNSKLKIALIAAAALLVVLVGVVVAIRLSLESAITFGVETIAPKVTGVKVELSGLRLALLRGELSIGSFTLGNPNGYGTPNALKTKTVFVKIQPMSVLSGKIIVNKILVDGVDVNYEQALTTSNMFEIKANVDAFAKSLSNVSSSKDGNASSSSASDAGKKLQVDSLEIKNVHVSIAAKGLSGAVGAPVPDIKMEALGSGPEGITPGDLAVKIMDSLLGGIISSAKSVLPDLSKVADGVGKAASGAVDGAKTGAGKVADGAKGVVDGVLNVFK